MKKTEVLVDRQRRRAVRDRRGENVDSRPSATRLMRDWIKSRETLARENLGALATIEHRDIFTLDLSGADVITVFLYPRLMERLIPQFEKLKPGSRIVSHQFEMPGVPADQTLIVESKEDGDKHRILLWTTPLKVKPAP